MDNYNILKGLGIPENMVRRVYSQTEQDLTLINVLLKANQLVCPYCKNTNVVIKEYKKKTIKNLPTLGMKTFVEFTLPRYKCKACLKTYTHNIDFATEKLISKPVIEKIMEDCKTMSTFSQIAERYDISPTEVINIFDKHCPNLRQPIDEVISIDEFSNTRKSEDKYSCIMIDFKTGKIIDIIPNRTLPYLRKYFAKQHLKAREGVKFLTCDMYDAYITIAKEYFPNCQIAIDPFHYMEYFTEAVQNTRRDLIDSGIYLMDKSWMGKHWRLLTTNSRHMPKGTTVLNTGETISYADRVERFVRQDSELNYAYYLLQDFYDESRKATYEKACSLIDMTINNMLTSTNKYLNECGKTWDHYKEYIKNSFKTIYGRRLSNGPAEGVNSRVKTLKKLYCGYRNKDRFYERIILIINNEANVLKRQKRNEKLAIE